MFSSDAPFVAYVLQYKYLINCTKIVQDKLYFLQYCRFTTKYTALHQNEEKWGKYMKHLKSSKTLSNQSVQSFHFPCPTQSLFSQCGRYEPCPCQLTGKGWVEPSQAKVTEASVFKIISFSTVQCALCEKMRGKFEFQQLMKLELQREELNQNACSCGCYPTPDSA